MRTDIKTAVAAVAATGVVAAGLYVAVPASATEPQSSPTVVSPTATDRPGNLRERRRERRLRGVHGEATVRRDGGFAKVAWQRGEITAVSGGTVTVRSEDGVVWQWTVDGSTTVRRNGAQSSPSALAVRDRVVVAGPSDGRTRTARRVIVPRRG